MMKVKMNEKQRKKIGWQYFNFHTYIFKATIEFEWLLSKLNFPMMLPHESEIFYFLVFHIIWSFKIELVDFYTYKKFYYNNVVHNQEEKKNVVECCFQNYDFSR